MKGFHKLLSDESGQILPMFALMLVILMGLAAITIDGGGVHQLKNTVNNIAESSALSASDDLSWGPEEDIAKETAMSYALENGAEADRVIVTTEYGIPTKDGRLVDRVSVKVSMTYKMTFGKLIGKSDKLVTGEYSVNKKR